MFGRKKRVEEQIQSGSELESTRNDLLAVTPLPDSARLQAMAQETDGVPQWRPDNDVCYCGRVELVYGGEVQVELPPDQDGSGRYGGTVMHRKWTMCERMPLRQGPGGIHHYGR